MPRHDARDAQRCRSVWETTVKHVDTIIAYVAAGTSPENDAIYTQGANAALRGMNGNVVAVLALLVLPSNLVPETVLPKSFVDAVWQLSDKFEQGLVYDAQSALFSTANNPLKALTLLKERKGIIAAVASLAKTSNRRAMEWLREAQWIASDVLLNLTPIDAPPEAATAHLATIVQVAEIDATRALRSFFWDIPAAARYLEIAKQGGAQVCSDILPQPEAYWDERYLAKLKANLSFRQSKMQVSSKEKMYIESLEQEIKKVTIWVD